MPPRVRITDVSPRDGLQNEPLAPDSQPVPTHAKLALINLLANSGLDEIELTSLVSPTWIPQLADADEILRITKSQHTNNPLPHAAPIYSVLVPNEKGFDRALAFHDPDAGFPLKIALFTAASETFSLRNTNASIARTLDRFAPIIPRALAAGMRIRLYISCAVACPFEGAISPARVRRVADDLLALFDSDAARDAAELDLGDTLGAATVDHTRALLTAFELSQRESLTLHLHDTFARAAPCVAAALDMGVHSFDGAAGGLGGCPYASTPGRRAPGNISTELLVRTVRAAGYETGVDEHALAEAGRFARSIVSGAAQTGDTP